jgi:hypothetical protein
MSNHAQFINVLQNKKQSVFSAKQSVLNRVTAAKQRILSPVTVIPTYDDVQAVSYDDKLTSPEMYDSVYTEGTQPYQQPPIESEEGNIRKHVDGSFSVIEADGYVHNFGFDEQTARSYGAHTIAKDKAIEEDAPEPGSVGDITNRLTQATVGIGGMGYTGVVGTGQTLRHQIDDYNSRGALRPVVIEPGSEYAGQRNPKITEEDESKFNNIEQLPSEIQKLYRQSLKFKILNELKNRAEETKENLVVAEEDIADINKAIPVDRAAEAARSADFKYVAETEGLWEATKHTLKEDWSSYLYGGIDAIPYMAVLATGNIPAITTLVTSMAIGNNVDNTKEFLRLNDGREPTQDEAARIQLFSAAQAAVDAIGDRLAVAGLPKAAIAALSKQLISAKKVLASTAKSVPSILNNFATRTVAKIAIAPAKMVVTEAPAGAAEEASRQMASGGEISDPAAIVEAAIIEGFAAPVAAPTVRVGAAVGKAVKKAFKGKEVDTPETTETTEIIESTESTEGIEPPLPIDQAEFDTLIESVVYVEEGDQTENIKTLHELRKRELTSTQEEIHAKKVTELENKINNKTANTNPVDDEGKASLENVVNLTEEEFKKVEEDLTGSKDSKEEDKAYLESISKLIIAKKRAEASISTVSEDIREGVEERHKGASTLFSEIKTLVNSLVAPNADPGRIHREILTKINELQTHSGNLERKEEAFKKAEDYVVDESKEIPESAELDTNEAIVDKNGVKPRVGTGDTGSAIVIGTTKNRLTTYTVYYNQSRAEIKDANTEHEGYVTEITRLKTGKSSINNLVNAVAEDNKYVDAVATAATAYLESTIYADTKNRVVALKDEQATIAALAEQEYNRKITEVTKEELDTIDVEEEVTPDTEPTRTGTINVFWGKPESNESTRILSNLAPRTFTYEGREYGSVEHAYQSNKSGTFDQDTYDKYVAAGESGRKIKGKGTIEELEAADSLGLMKQLVVESFIQNPDSKAAAKLMQYAEFTHDNDGLIDQAFLDGLYLAQESLDKSAQISADAKEVVEDSETTPPKGTSPEGTPVTPQGETAVEVPSEGSSAEIQTQIDALAIELEKAKAREAAEAAEQGATPPVTEESIVEEGTVATETVSDVTDTDTADTVVEKTITYNLKGQATQTYTVKGSKIFNKNNVEVFKEDSPHRNKIFANLAVKEGRAQVVEHDKKKYVVNDKQQIMSVATGNIMKWAENHGSRKAILKQVQPVQESVQESSEVSFKLDNNLSLQESELDVHTLSVLFPAAINADSTLKTGDTADIAINKLGKFLKVCE